MVFYRLVIVDGKQQVQKDPFEHPSSVPIGKIVNVDSEM